MNNFPPDDMFTFVMVQEMAKECQDWQKKMTAAQTEVNKEGKVIKNKITQLNNRINEYTNKQKENCTQHCEKS